MSPQRFELESIAVVRGGRSEAVDDGWGTSRCEIVLDEGLPDGLLAGLEDFSHLEVISIFHLVDPEGPFDIARHPRGDKRLPSVGALAQRHKDRRNRLGLSIARIEEVGLRSVSVSGLDLVDGTPLLDLKPWFDAFGPRGKRREPSWVSSVVQRYY